ncbi:uncharacterized protein LOC126900498 isoform X4 [Daktulosphaira vitifoliae]|uniref:uncharacterized protein LOC126900498 isoform X4 n=1 Tax=Daktulosphaira vitifoliae TaxID=58002 RepID=UPI0021A9CB5A|nr:uncharacterized protein LOC126900498 isoform X4 [Daktulosphaira vitifoliae]
MNSTYYERHCNYSRYMLNYFKINEHYLLQMYKNIEIYTKEDLKKYGRAFQTHGEVVLLMIQDLHKINQDCVALDLLTVNLYLNNNSGSINVMYRYETGNNIGYNNLFLGIQGLRLQNYSMMIQLERFINSSCSKEPIAEFVEYPNKNVSNELNIDKLNLFTNDLREKMIKEINPGNVEINNITKFHPKNLLFYNIMSNHSDKIEIKNTESRQHQEFNVDGNPKNILDLLRFVPLNLQCADKSFLYVTDVFRFVKYQFLFDNVRSFQKLLLAAAFHPVGMLIANHIHFGSGIVRSRINPQYYKINGKTCIQHLGEKIKIILYEFIDLNIFIKSSKSFLTFISNNFAVILSWIGGTRLKVENLPIITLRKLELFFTDNKLKFNVESEIIVTDQSIMPIYDLLLKKVNQVELYVQELNKYKKSFELIYDIQYLGRITNNDQRFFLVPNLIDVLCADNPIDYCNSKNDKSDTSDNSNEINVYDLGNNDGLDEFKTENIEHFKEVAFKRKQNKSLNLSIDMKDFPKHMVDYFLCSE